MVPLPATAGPGKPRLEDLVLDLARSLTELPRLLAGAERSDQALRRLSALCSATVPSCDRAATLVRQRDGTLETPTPNFSPEVSLDRVQIASRRGPGIEALAKSTLVRASLPDERWPEFSAVAGHFGVRSLLAVPIPPHGRAEGSLSLFSHHPHAFGEVAELIAAVFAAQCALALSRERLRERADLVADQMRQALESRAVIDQAKGIVMERRRCDADAAFAVLVERSQHANRKLRDIAADLVRVAVAGES